VRGNLDDLDEEFKQLENIIETQTNEYLGIINDMSNFETQSKIVNTRVNNYERLKESIKCLHISVLRFDDSTSNVDWRDIFYRRRNRIFNRT
jgi:archaellum component FlaC